MRITWNYFPLLIDLLNKPASHLTLRNYLYDVNSLVTENHLPGTSLDSIWDVS